MDTFDTRSYGRSGPVVSLKCKDGHYVKEIYGRSGKAIDGIGAVCTDNQNIGYSGGSGGDQFSFTSDDGFRAMEVRSNTSDVYQIRGYVKGSNGDGGVEKIFDRGSQDGRYPTFPRLSCYGKPEGSNEALPEDGRIVGFNVMSGKNVYSLGLICGNNFRKNCDEDRYMWDDDCNGSDPLKVVNPCNSDGTACFEKRVNYCKNASVFDFESRSRCLDFCKSKSGRCDEFMQRYCSQDDNKADDVCACINSPALNYNPICVDGKCIKSGYATQNMMDKKPCPDIVDCRVYNSIAETGRDVEFAAHVEQKCGGKEALVPQVVHPQGLIEQSPASEANTAQPTAQPASSAQPASEATSAQPTSPTASPLTQDTSPTGSVPSNGLSLMTKILIGIGIGIIVVLIVLYLFGFFDSGTSTATGGARGRGRGRAPKAAVMDIMNFPTMLV